MLAVCLRTQANARGQASVMRGEGAVLLDQVAHQFAIFEHVAFEMEQPAAAQLFGQQVDKGRREEPLDLVLFLPPGVREEHMHNIHAPGGDDPRQAEAGVVIAEPHVGQRRAFDPRQAEARRPGLGLIADKDPLW